MVRNRPATLALTGVLAALSCSPGAPAYAHDSRTFAFVGVHVVPMNGEGPLTDHTVVIEGDQIVRIGPRRELELASDVDAILATGRYLLPGLADMHTHVQPSSASEVEAQLLLYLATGITTLRNMVGSQAHLELKQRLIDGEVLGPRLFTVSPLLEGEDAVWPFAEKVLTPAEAEPLVAAYAAQDYEAIKIYHTLSGEVYESVIEAARAHGIPVVGHVPFDIGVERALRAGQYSIEHLRGYDIEGVSSQVLHAEGGRSAERFASWLAMSDERIQELARATAQAGVWNCPTIIVNDMLANLDELTRLADHPLAGYLPPQLRTRMVDNPLVPLFSPEARAMLGRVKPQQLKFVRALHDAGAGLLVGTDTVVPFLVPGFTVIEEITNFVQAGLTTHEAIAAATVEAARFHGVLDSSGTVEVGKRADLILLDANPLDDVANLRALSGVVVGGRWLSKADLQSALDRLAASYAAGDKTAGSSEPGCGDQPSPCPSAQ